MCNYVMVVLLVEWDRCFLDMYIYTYMFFYTACKLLLGFWLVGLFKWSLRWLRLVIGWNLRHILGLEHAHDSAWRFEITSKRSFYDAKMTTQ